MPVFIMSHHFVDNVHQNSDEKLLKKTSKFNKHWNTQRRKTIFIKRICSNFMREWKHIQKGTTYTTIRQFQ